MAAGRFQRFISTIVPSFMQGPNIGGFLESIGLTLDSATQTFQEGIRAANPLTCEADALPYLCRDRRIRRYPQEPEASIRRRLATWRQIKRHAGSAYGVMLNLQPYFLPGALPRIRTVSQAGDGSVAVWNTLNQDGTRERHLASPSNWDFDGVTWKTILDISGATNANPIVVTTSSTSTLRNGLYVKITSVVGNTNANGTWPITIINGTTFSIPVAGNAPYGSGGHIAVNYRSRFWVIVDVSGTRMVDQTYYDDGSLWDGGQVYDGVLAAEGANMVSIINDSKRASTVLWGLILTQDSSAFDPTDTSVALPDGSTSLPAGNWGPIIDPATHLPTRPPYASFYLDRGQA